MPAPLKQTPEIHGHRGARGLYPENSLIAVNAGIDAGSDAIEVDLCVNKDGQLIVHHDPILSPRIVRDATGNWVDDGIRIKDCTLAELKKFDIGKINPNSAYSKTFAGQQPVDNTRIPTLQEFVELVLERSDSVKFNLELKSTPYDTQTTPQANEYVKIVVDELVRYNIIDRVLLQSFDWRLVLKSKSYIPELKIGLLTGQQADGNPTSPVSGRPTLWTDMNDSADFPNIPTMVKFTGGDVWSSNHLDLSRSAIEIAHDLGLEVCAWTVNTQDAMIKMIEWGVDAITTDYPDQLVQIVKKTNHQRANLTA